MATQYATKATAVELGQQLVNLRTDGWTRPQMQEATGLTPAQLWRVEQGRAHQHEVEIVTTFVTAIKEGKIVKPESTKTSKVDYAGKIAELEARLDEALARIAALESEPVTNVSDDE